MTWVTPSIIAVLTGSSILTLAYFYLAMQERDRSLLIWAFAWAFQVIRYLFDLFNTLMEGQSPDLHSVLQTGNYLAAIATGFLLLWGTHVFMGKKLPRWWVIVILATSVWVLVSGLFFFSFMASTLPTFTLQGIIFIMTGTALLRHRELGKAARTITGWAFIIWGTHKLEYFIARQIKALVPWGYLLSAVLEIVVALGIIMAYFQKTRDELKESEERYHSLFEKCQSIMLIIDPQTGAYLDANAAACSFYGYTREEMKRKFIWDINTLSREEIFALMRLTLKGKGGVFEFQDRLAGGEVRDVEVHTGPIKYDGQQVFYSIVHDITDRKRAEYLLRMALLYTRSLIEVNLDPLFAISPEGKITDVNMATEIVTGVSRDRLLGTDFSDYFTEPDRAREGYCRVLAEEVVRDYPLSIRHTSGLVTNVIYNASVFRDESDTLQGIFATARDISELMRAEEEIRVLAKFASEDPYPVMRIAMNGTLLYINKNGSQMLPDWHLQVGQPVPPILGDAVSQALDLGSTQVLCLGHGQRMFSFTVAPVVDTDYVNLYGSDITERKNFEEVLKNASAQWNATFDAIGNPIFLLDRERKILRCNAAVTEMLLKPFSEIIGRHCYELFHGLDEPPEGCRFAHMVEGGRKDIKEVRFGDRMYEILLYPWLERDGKVRGAVHILTDVTTRKTAAEELRTSREELRNLAAHLQNVREEERTHVAREIHDELIQALTALKMDVSWIRDRLEKSSARDRILAMTDLINKTMKTVHRISAELRPGMLDDLGLSAAVDWQMKEFQQRTGIKCHLRMEPNEIIPDRKRSTALFRILQESLANIYRHAKASRIDVCLQLKDDLLTMEVKDNGLGITDEQRTASGSFGLIGMRERALMLGGEVGIDGVTGKGTTIVVRMPAREEEEIPDDKNTHS